MRLGRWLTGAGAAVIVIAGAFWIVTAPHPLPASAVPTHTANIANGELMFWAGGCISCHLSADAVTGDKPELGGGKPLATRFGTFYPPNISPDPATGIGRWSDLDFVNAMQRGLTPAGRHLYPAFPYTSYQRMTVADLIDLKAFLDTLPAVTRKNQPNALPFPLSIRRGIGLWKVFFLDGKEFAPDPAKSTEINRGAYLVEGPGHCNECHTSRLLFGLGGLDMTHHLGGAPNLAGRGRAANLTPGKNGIGDDSASDLLDSLELGTDFSKSMSEVQQNLQHLPESDLAAIVAYLKQLPPVDAPPKHGGGDS
jgi:mono/diheme cytochrome c family protein